MRSSRDGHLGDPKARALAHVSESGEIVPDAPPFLPLRNGGFEEGAATGAPLGWRVVGTGGKNGTWSMDATQSATPGGRSMRLDAPAGVGLSARLLSDPVPAVSRTIIAGTWVAFFQACQQ